jgi:hypothetical protein
LKFNFEIEFGVFRKVFNGRVSENVLEISVLQRYRDGWRGRGKHGDFEVVDRNSLAGGNGRSHENSGDTRTLTGWVFMGRVVG